MCARYAGTDGPRSTGVTKALPRRATTWYAPRSCDPQHGQPAIADVQAGRNACQFPGAWSPRDVRECIGLFFRISRSAASGCRLTTTQPPAPRDRFAAPPTPGPMIAPATKRSPATGRLLARPPLAPRPRGAAVGRRSASKLDTGKNTNAIARAMRASHLRLAENGRLRRQTVDDSPVKSGRAGLPTRAAASRLLRSPRRGGRFAPDAATWCVGSAWPLCAQGRGRRPALVIDRERLHDDRRLRTVVDH